MTNIYRWPAQRVWVIALLSMLALAVHARGQDTEKETPKGIDVSGFKKYEGFFDFYWDDEAGKIWLQLDDKFSSPFIYVSSLASGLGSNPVGLDRGQLGKTRLVQFLKVGPRVFLEELNTKFRATSQNAAEQQAVKDSFANSIIWSTELKQSKAGEQLADLTSLLVRDAHSSSRKLSSTGQGSFTFDKQMSYVHLPRTRSFPENSEFEAAVTMVSKQPGPLARRTSAAGDIITLRQHHSFVKLPDDQYRPRVFDPRCGAFSISYQDYSASLDDSLEKRLITRHRLVRKDPNARKSRAVEPIVYYVDSGVPSPVKEALIEGASWWNSAFESAGFIDAFQVKELPADADPMDVRFNVIQWVHRATRGWSYGQSVVDPRTGEIIKGHVLLGSLRVRQDLTLVGGLSSHLADASRSSRGPRLSPAAEGNEYLMGQSCLASMAPTNSFSRLLSTEKGQEVALARIRQLSAHEVGHTLGFAHNFAASTYGDRASVMDYPAPRTRIVDGKVDLSDAYGVGIGIWDRFTVQYAYTEFEDEENESKGLARLLTMAQEQNWLYITDSDSRPLGAAHPFSSLWDNGTDPVQALEHEIRVRKIALANFGKHLIRQGESLSELEKSFVPLYLHHRYQVDATAKSIGGIEYYYSVKGDAWETHRPVKIDVQKDAFEVLLSTLDPEFLNIPDSVLELIPPRPFTSASDRERFSSRSSPVFDMESAVEVAARLTLANLLQPQRLARLNALKSADWNQAVLLTKLSDRLFDSAEKETEAHGQVRRLVQAAYVEQLIDLVSKDSIAWEVHAIALRELKRLGRRLGLPAKSKSIYQGAHQSALKVRIDRELTRPGRIRESREQSETPPGSPIGQ